MHRPECLEGKQSNFEKVISRGVGYNILHSES